MSSVSSTREEAPIQPSYYQLNGNYSAGSQGSRNSLLQGMQVPRTPNKTFKISDNFPRKTLSERTKEIITHPRMLSRIVLFLDLHDILRVRNFIYEFRLNRDLKRIFKKRLEFLVSQIRTKEDQYKFWNHVVEFRRIRSEKPLAFTQNFVRKCEHIRDITKDLDRTFPEYEKFTTEKGKDGLLKVLVAFSNTMKEVGYIQGLNSVAGVFLYYLKEEESFWMMLYLMEGLKTKEIFKSDFAKVSLLNYQLECFINYYLPSLAQYFQDQPEYLSNITTQWFITLYSYSLSIPNIVKIWNQMFIKGIPFLIQFALAVLSRYKNQILNSNIDELGSFIREELRQLSDNEESLFLMALDFRVTKKLMKDLEIYYKNGKPKVFLTFDSQKRGTWSEVPSYTEKTETSMSMNSYRLEAGRSRTDSATGTNRKSPTGKGKSSPFIQTFVNTIKIDFSDTLKNIFTRKDTNSATLTEPSTANRSSFIEDERFQEKSINLQTPPSKLDLLDKDREMSKGSLTSIYSTEIPQRSSSFYMPEQSTLRDRLDPPSIQTSYKPSISEPKSSLIPQRPSPNPRSRQTSNVDFFTKDFQLPIGEVRPPLYGRPKIRPNNNSIDASDLSTLSADKDFIRSLHSNMSTKYLNGSPTPQIHSSTRLSSFADDFKKPIYPKGKTVIEVQRPQTINIYSINLAEDSRSGHLKKNYDEVMGRRISSSPKKTNINSQTTFKPEVINLQLSRKPGHHYSVIGDYKKYP